MSMGQDQDQVLEGEPTADVRIAVTTNGPYVIEGPVELEGRIHANVVLCRCGRSESKPYCDGSHLRTAWVADADEDHEEG